MYVQFVCKQLYFSAAPTACDGSGTIPTTAAPAPATTTVAPALATCDMSPMFGGFTGVNGNMNFEFSGNFFVTFVT